MTSDTKVFCTRHWMSKDWCEEHRSYFGLEETECDVATRCKEVARPAPEREAIYIAGSGGDLLALVHRLKDVGFDPIFVTPDLEEIVGWCKNAT